MTIEIQTDYWYLVFISGMYHYFHFLSTVSTGKKLDPITFSALFWKDLIVIVCLQTQHAFSAPTQTGFNAQTQSSRSYSQGTSQSTEHTAN